MHERVHELRAQLLRHVVLPRPERQLFRLRGQRRRVPCAVVRWPGVGSTDEKLARLRELGAHHGVNYRAKAHAYIEQRAAFGRVMMRPGFVTGT